MCSALSAIQTVIQRTVAPAADHDTKLSLRVAPRSSTGHPWPGAKIVNTAGKGQKNFVVLTAAQQCWLGTHIVQRAGGAPPGWMTSDGVPDTEALQEYAQAPVVWSNKYDTGDDLEERGKYQLACTLHLSNPLLLLEWAISNKAHTCGRFF